MVKQNITLGHLYPCQMNVYGDMGNIITLRYRLEQRGFLVKYIALDSAGDLRNNAIDILVGGGGQDSNQETVNADLQKYAPVVKSLCSDGITMLMICGMYQLFGHRFITGDQEEIRGIGVFDMETIAGKKRLIGNVVVDSQFGELVGFENHSGKTYLASNTKPLGTILKGAGNNGKFGDEGAMVQNVFGTYMHGPVLAKNPKFADALIIRALEHKGINTDMIPIDDTFSVEAAKVAAKRPY